MPSRKPSLALTTPVTSTFPPDALKPSAMSAKTPLSASWRDLPSAGLPSAGIVSPYPGVVAIKTEDGLAKTPITPPLAYMDFLKAMSVASPAFPSPSMTSPPPTGKHPLNRTSTAGSTASNKTDASVSSSDDSNGEDRDEREVESAPSTATSEATDVSCHCDHVHKSPTKAAAAAAAVPPSPFAGYPLSAPATGPASFPSMKIPPSPMTNADSPVRSPFSARSVKSPFDWEAALKARRYADVKSNHSCAKPSSSRTSVRHIREVVTRTVTYTPRMQAAPKGKRRKVDKEAEI